MAIAAGVSVANIYYNQPILAAMARGIGVSESAVGNLPVFTQAGYGAGLLLLTPLGDKADRKKLILLLQGGLILALTGMMVVHSLTALIALSFGIGLLSVSTQVIMPMAAALSAPESKGKVVGIVYTGALTGILGARIFSGFIAAHLGWQYVYGISAGLLLCTTTMVWLGLPKAPPQYLGHYLGLLRSTLGQLGRFSLLRRIALLGAVIFGAFCSFWTTITFQLSGAPFHYKSDVIGLFGFLAIGGALAASLFGRLADKSSPARTQIFTVSLVLLSVLLVWWWPHSVTAFIATTVLFDVGVQATQVSSLAQIYTLDAGAHSRINTVYMTCMFIGGAIGTWVGVQCWARGGWELVCRQLLLWSVVALGFAVVGYVASRKRGV